VGAYAGPSILNLLKGSFINQSAAMSFAKALAPGPWPCLTLIRLPFTLRLEECLEALTSIFDPRPGTVRDAPLGVCLVFWCCVML